ncbi:MAG: MEDS domain-containing protein [bacterium]
MSSKMQGHLKTSGIDYAIREIHQGTHLCQFYRTEEDLTDILIPYFKAGIEHKELCLWFVADPCRERAIQQAIQRIWPDFNEYVKEGRIEIISPGRWYQEGEKVNPQGAVDRLLGELGGKIGQAATGGYHGLRFVQDAASLDEQDRPEFTDYEKEMSRIVDQCRMTALCCYPLDRWSAAKIIDIVSSHRLTLVKRDEEWKMIENSGIFTAPEKACEGYGKSFPEGSGRSGMDYPPAPRHTQGRNAEVPCCNVSLFGGEVDEVQGTFAAGRDIDELRRAEKKLKTYMAKLEKSNQELQDFAFAASHDLQEPLRKIQSFGDQLKVKYFDHLGAEGRDYLERMQSAAKRMQALIRALLSYSRVTTMAEPFSTISLTGLAREVVADLETRVRETGGRVRIEDLADLEADPNQMRQLFQNLICNALKFHGREKPLIRIYGQKNHSSAQYRIFIQDNGIGFDEKYLDRLFIPFQRLHGRSSGYEGTGMGLAICRKIVERHGGTITARSTQGKGSTFMITLPVKQFKEEEV